MVSTVAEIIALTKEEDLVSEMKSFEISTDKRVAEVERLLAINVRSVEEITLQDHMVKVEAHRQTVVRIFALTTCFLEHAKSPCFQLEGGTEFQRHAKMKQLVAPFAGMNARFDGLVRSIDSRVNLCKVLLRVANEGMGNTHVQ